MKQKDKTKTPTPRVYSVYLPTEYKEIIKQRARVERRKISGVVQNALDFYFSHLEAAELKNKVTE